VDSGTRARRMRSKPVAMSSPGMTVIRTLNGSAVGRAEARKITTIPPTKIKEATILRLILMQNIRVFIVTNGNLFQNDIPTEVQDIYGVIKLRVTNGNLFQNDIPTEVQDIDGVIKLENLLSRNWKDENLL
jgi:hypothetical protein